MIGTIGLKDLRIDCVVGIYDFERVKLQPLFVDVALRRDFAAAAASDAIADTIDYDHVAALLTELATSRKYELLETFAEEGVAGILARWDDVVSVTMEIRKPEAVPAAACSFVSIERTR